MIFLFCFIFQIADETSTQTNLQTSITFKVRRLGTESSVDPDVDHPFSAHWRWFWLDSFGMWRSYPVKKSDVIDSNITCLSDDIETKYLEYEASEGNTFFFVLCCWFL